MKDLLEVIEDGMEGFENLTNPYCVVDNLCTGKQTRDKEKQIDHLNTHTKAILTNQIERMKGEQRDVRTLETHPNEWVECMNWEDEAHNHALQTQIDYLEDILEKLG